MGVSSRESGLPFSYSSVIIVAAIGRLPDLLGEPTGLSLSLSGSVSLSLSAIYLHNVLIFVFLFLFVVFFLSSLNYNKEVRLLLRKLTFSYFYFPWELNICTGT